MFPLLLSYLLLHLVLGVQEPTQTSAGGHYRGYAVSGSSARRRLGVPWVPPNWAMLGTPRSTVRALEVAGRAGASHPVIVPEYYWQHCFRHCRHQHSRLMQTTLCCACLACARQVWVLEEAVVAYGVVSNYVTVVVAAAAEAGFEGVERLRRPRLPARRGPRSHGGRLWQSTHVGWPFRRNPCWCPGGG